MITHKTEKYDEGTMMKVFSALKGIIEDSDKVLDSINAMLNAGILFRERPIIPHDGPVCRSTLTSDEMKG